MKKQNLSSSSPAHVSQNLAGITRAKELILHLDCEGVSPGWYKLTGVIGRRAYELSTSLKVNMLRTERARDLLYGGEGVQGSIVVYLPGRPKKTDTGFFENPSPKKIEVRNPKPFTDEDKMVTRWEKVLDYQPRATGKQLKIFD